MMPRREWLKPPRTLLAILFVVTLVSVSALGWFGWKLLDQERAVEAQRAHERLEQAADRAAAIARGTLAETGERLGTWLLVPPPEGKPDEGLLLIVAEGKLDAMPRQRLLYRPATPANEEPDAFADAEVLEFQQALPARAADAYQRMAAAKNAAIQAGALIRLARVLRKMNRMEEARAAYVRVTEAGPDVRTSPVGGVPAELIARHALNELPALKQDLLGGRWQLTRGQFEYYWSEASEAAPLPAGAVAFSDVVAQSWPQINQETNPRGQSTVWVGQHPWLLIWRSVPGRKAIFITRPESLLKTVFANGDVLSAAVDGEGRLVAGSRASTGYAAVRTPAESHLPWTLYMTSSRAVNMAGTLSRQRFLLLVVLLTVSFLIAGAYFIARAIRGDLAVARMQSDFVSAVSHEFRSPLTSIRQLSELLAFDRVPGEGRRHVYYETLLRESIRLQRLVEALLNFGRMEAGVRQYRFEPLDTAALVARVASEFEPQISATGRHIELGGCSEQCTIHADPEALSVALRNLVDNALKYAPNCPAIEVRWRVERSRVAISVRDRGPGIPASEKRAIFRQFVRGSAAEAANVKGSGVGLAMVQHIIAAHGGDVTLASEPGAGSVFTILLPLGAEQV
ncbi:MAG TPA: HAMP domain-containing sensor histidine kinase [Bryobacteraceae bacterium]|nr:HAMP domain-containing sensor histidine kinase [Bryobacteraceae bacterium]